jgi:predicted SAM-dependent methyltransferase
MNPLRWRIMKSKTLAAHPLTRGAILGLRQVVSRSQAKRYLQQCPEPKLHVGCGRYSLEGWLNADINLDHSNIDIFLDARDHLPFEDDQFQFVYAEHLIEHLTYDEGRRFCKEVFRILRPGGVMRISTPDLQFLLRYYADHSEIAEEFTEYHTREFLRADVRSRALVLSNFFYDFGHRIIYDWDLLVELLREAGLQRVERRRAGESSYPELRGIEQHGRDYPFNEEESLVVEAEKPQAS